MKRFFSCVLALIFLLSCCPGTENWLYTEAVAAAEVPDASDDGVDLFPDGAIQDQKAANDPRDTESGVQMMLIPSKTEVSGGETVEFTITMSELVNCRSGGVSVMYDTNRLEYVENSGTCTLEGILMGSFAQNGDVLAGTFLYAVGGTVEGEVFRFQMKVKSDAPAGSTTVSLEGAAKTILGESVEVTEEPVVLYVKEGEIPDQPENPDQPVPPEEPEEPDEPEEPEVQVHMTLIPDVTQVPQGGAISFTVAMSELADCRSAAVAFDYDESIFEYEEGSGRCLVSGTLMNSFGMVSEKLSGVFTYSGVKNTSGNIFSFKMKVKDTAALGMGTISMIGSARNSGGAVTVTAEAAVVEVLCNHDWSEWSRISDTEHLRICGACEETQTEAHQWGDGNVTKPATCVGEGIMTYVCGGCRTEYTESIPATGIHSWSSWQVQCHATCTEPGSEIRNCENCVAQESQTVPELGHDWSEQIQDEAHLYAAAENCTQFHMYWYDCSRCDLHSTTVYFAGTIAGPHSFTEQIRDDAHVVPGSDPVLYYYDCEHCDTMGTETYEAACGDLDGDDAVDEDDAIYLLQFVLMPELFPVTQNADIDGNGIIDEDDAIYLLQHVLMPELFPL